MWFSLDKHNLTKNQVLIYHATTGMATTCTQPHVWHWNNNQSAVCEYWSSLSLFICHSNYIHCRAKTMKWKPYLSLTSKTLSASRFQKLFMSYYVDFNVVWWCVHCVLFQCLKVRELQDWQQYGWLVIDLLSWTGHTM